MTRHQARREFWSMRAEARAQRRLYLLAAVAGLAFLMIECARTLAAWWVGR